MVLNHADDGLGGDTNRVVLVERSRRRALPTLSKREVAEAVLDRALELSRARRRVRVARGRSDERARPDPRAEAARIVASARRWIERERAAGWTSSLLLRL